MQNMGLFLFFFSKKARANNTNNEKHTIARASVVGSPHISSSHLFRSYFFLFIRQYSLPNMYTYIEHKRDDKFSRHMKIMGCCRTFIFITFIIHVIACFSHSMQEKWMFLLSNHETPRVH